MLKRWLILSLALVLSGTALADQYHYHNVLIGDRAMGMGGAFGAVADDASGVYYNPAGLAFALSNDISGSANAMVSKTITYKNTIGGEDFEERSSGTIPAFFGGLQKLDSISKKLVFAFGISTIDGELKDQDDLVLNKPHTSHGANGAKQEINIIRFHRTNNIRATTSYAGGALGYRLSNNMAVGAGLNYITVDELTQDYQDVHMRLGSADLVRTQNLRQYLSAIGLQLSLGFQMSMDRFSFGLTYKVGSYVSQTLEGAMEKRDLTLATAAGDKVVAKEPFQGTMIYDPSAVADDVMIEDPLGSMPTEARVAFAWFVSTRALVTLDLIHHGAVTDAAEIAFFEGQSGDELRFYNKEAIMDFAAGMEYYIQPAVPLRLGLFTNNSNAPEIEEGKNAQLDHVDYVGESIFLAWVQPNSQIAAGLILQQGSGKAQKAGDYAIQDVEGSMFTFAFSATHSF